MKLFLALALMLFVVLACDNSNNSQTVPSRSGPSPGQNSGQSSGQGSGPAARSGFDPQDPGPSRDPYDNQDAYNQRQQGRQAPCVQSWDAYHAAYFQNKNGQMAIERFREYENAYKACVEYYYYRR